MGIAVLKGSSKFVQRLGKTNRVRVQIKNIRIFEAESRRFKKTLVGTACTQFLQGFFFLTAWQIRWQNFGSKGHWIGSIAC